MAKIPIRTITDKKGKEHNVFCNVKHANNCVYYLLTVDNKDFLECKQIDSGCDKLLYIINENL